MKKIFLIFAFLILPALSFAQEKDDNLAYQSFEQGRNAYALGRYIEAVAHFERACNQALIFTSAYYIWLGTAGERAYDTGQDAPNRLDLLRKSADAYRTALEREQDPDVRYELGRLTVKYAMARANFVLERENNRQPLPLDLPPPVLRDSTWIPARFQPATIDSLHRIWHLAEGGLRDIWMAILGRTQKEIVYAAPQRSTMSDTLQAYLSVYIENSLNLIETAGQANFEGIEPDFYIPKIAAASSRGVLGDNPDWFNQVLAAARFDGGYNMRCAIYRLKGLRHSKEEKADHAIHAMQRALIYARSDTSRAALYLDMAFTAYRDDLPRAVEYAKYAYAHNQYEPRVCDTYGGLSLSLASVKLKEGAYREAISTIYPVTSFGWQDRGEALITLAIAYFNSDLQNVGARAYQAAEMAYRIAPERYWKEFHRIAKSQGNYVQARQLEEKHSSALLSKKQDTSP
ncbi:MAG: hypothetical protein OXG87_17900 [Gemmatimonadetes bacterium]|nr:hypothetical protein [Gemmatimonadota bacterium]